MPRDNGTPFATKQVLRGLDLALRFAEAHAARHVGYVSPLLSTTPTTAEIKDIERARAWLDYAIQERKRG